MAKLIRYKRAMIKLFVHLCVKAYYHSFKPSYSTHVTFIDMDEINISDYRDITINAWLKPRTYLFRLFPEVSAEETSMALSFVRKVNECLCCAICSIHFVAVF